MSEMPRSTSTLDFSDVFIGIHYDMCPDKSDLAALALELAVNTAQAGIGWFTWPNLAGNSWKSLFSLANRGKPIKYQSGIKEKLWSIGWISAGNRSLFSSQESQSGSTCSTVPTNWIPDRGGIQHCQTGALLEAFATWTQTIHFGKKIIFNHIQSYQCNIHMFDWWNKDVQPHKTTV